MKASIKGIGQAHFRPYLHTRRRWRWIPWVKVTELREGAVVTGWYIGSDSIGKDPWDARTLAFVSECRDRLGPDKAMEIAERLRGEA